MFEAANVFMKHQLEDIMSYLKERRESYEKKLEEVKQQESS
jgi:chaperonin cofactor prefoldin